MNTERNLGMKTIRVQKEKLLDTLKTNRDNHISEYQEAVELYYDDVLSKLDKKRREVKKAGVDGILDINTVVSVSAPVSYKDEYDTTIEMLEWSTDDFIDLTQDEFKRYVKDEWNWSENFKTLRATYSRKN